MPLNFFRDNKIINLKAVLTTFLATIITVGAGIWVTSLVGPVPISVTQRITDQEQTFKASGETEIEVVPDEAQVSLGIDLERSTVVAAQNAANEIINSITDALKDLGIDGEDIKTRNYNIRTTYDYDNGNRRVTGYRVNTQIVVKLTDFTKLNQAIDTATGLGANQVGGINFSLSEDKQDELRQQARKEAITDAKDNANELARLAGVNLGKVINVTESKTGSAPQPYYARTMALDSAAGPEEPTQIEPGTETYRYSVTLSYETI